MGRARAIYENGRILGASARTVAKVGDCISDNQHFLSPFGGAATTWASSPTCKRW